MPGSASTEESGGDSEYWKCRRQGDILPIREIPVVGASVRLYPTPNGAAIISQTCDVVLSNRPNVLVAAVVELAPTEAVAARDGARPRYVHIPLFGDSYFVDLEYVASVEKSSIDELSCTSGVDGGSDGAIRTFALAVARRFGRFPFPDEVSAWLRPLRSAVEDKYDKPNSGLGLALGDISELRIEAVDWQHLPVDLTLHIITYAGVLPEIDDDESISAPPELDRWLRPAGKLIRSLGDIANRLYRYELAKGSILTSVEKYHLWLAFGEAFAERCGPRGADQEDPSIVAAVTSVAGNIASEDEFTLTQIRRSETLDLDHLSGPYPLSS